MGRVTIVAFTLLYAVCFFAFCLAVTFDDCGSTAGKFTEVSVSGCETSEQRCTLVRNTNASISIKFIPKKDISEINVRIYGIVLDVPIPFPFEKSDVCKDPDDGIECPLHKDQEYHYVTSMFVQKKYPAVSVDIKWEFVNDKNEKVICIQFPAKIK